MNRVMKPVLTMLLSAVLSVLFAACGVDGAEGVNGADGVGSEGVDGSDVGSAAGGETENEDEKDSDMKITIRVGGAEFAATLDDTSAGRAFARMLPLTLDMTELNGNEKYHYLSQSLPESAVRCETIFCGDLMLYGSSCVVLFYKTFASGYSYTRLGRVDNPDGLSEALGRGNIEVTFE